MPSKPLTTKEKAWLKKLEAVLMECPSDRLGCYTIGDCDLHFFDKIPELRHMQECQHVRELRFPRFKAPCCKQRRQAE